MQGYWIRWRDKMTIAQYIRYDEFISDVETVSSKKLKKLEKDFDDGRVSIYQCGTIVRVDIKTEDSG